MKTLIGTTALAFLAAMSTTATADTYEYHCYFSGNIGDLQWSGLVDDTPVSSGGGWVDFHLEGPDHDYVFQQSATQVFISFTVNPDQPDIKELWGWTVDLGQTIDPNVLFTDYAGLQGQGQVDSLHGPAGDFGVDHITLVYHESNVVPGVGALAPLAGIAAIRRRRRR